MRLMVNPAISLAARALDILLPPLCLRCDDPVGGTASLCPACWGQIHFIATPFCACCGAVFDIPVGDGMLCGHCLATPPRFTSARAAMLYDDASRALVLGFKHGDRTHGARALAVWMHRAGGDMLARADALLPVPLHRWRLWGRRYNQSALLAQHIGDLAQKPVWVDVLRRIRATPSQGHRKRKERQDNVHNAFALAAGHDVTGKILVLIDDVLTTGATVEECSRVLLKAGAREVHVLTLSRVRSVV
ncbi:MAG: ComF family protein [Alphaproteobacteria bacterium]|nr:ComF family protein [Alphaproteobacteria bacterium]